jgi:hypothetical protein
MELKKLILTQKDCDRPWKYLWFCTGPLHYATSRKVAGSIPDEVIGFLDWPNPSSRIMALGSTQHPTEMSTRNLSGGKVWMARKADNLIAICEPTV